MKQTVYIDLLTQSKFYPKLWRRATLTFRYIVAKNKKEIAGFHDFCTACNFKEMMVSINHTASYKDHFQIMDLQENNPSNLVKEISLNFFRDHGLVIIKKDICW